MLIGVPKEIKNNEYRVGLTPSATGDLISHGHTVYLESQAGAAVGFSDKAYQKMGGIIVYSVQEIFELAQLIIKVKEPQLEECALLKPHHTLFTYLHLAPDPKQAKALMASGATCIAYETVTDKNNNLPLLAPMSAVAGRMSIQAGAAALEKSKGGRAILLGGVPGVAPAKVTIIGGGVVGENAAEMAIGLGAEVVILDRSYDTLCRLSKRFNNKVKTVYSTQDSLTKYVTAADLIIGAVLLPGGAAAPKLITRSLVKKMKKGAVLVDVAIDQGGCSETSRPTTHTEPTYIVDGVVHYCVANMPGAVARTSTIALNNTTLTYIIELANKGIKNALQMNPHLRHGLNVCKGQITCPHVSTALNFPLTDAEEILTEL